MISTRLQSTPTSSITHLYPFSTKTESSGVKVHHLNIGDPTTETPKEMLKVLHNWSQPNIPYAPSQGHPPLLDCLQTYYTKQGFKDINKSDMIIGLGGSECLEWTFFGICDIGDEVLVFEPFYSNYLSIASYAGVQLSAVSTEMENGFRLPSKKSIEDRITKKTKAILYTNPGNPTGVVYTKDEVEMLVSIASEKGIFLIADEPYRDFTFDRTSISILSYLDQIPELGILIDTLSKRYALCGSRLGLIYSRNVNFMQNIMKLASSRISAGLIDQHMGAEAMNVPDSYLTSVIQEYKKRRDLVFNELNSIPGVKANNPEGAFYIMASLPVEDAQAFSRWMLESFRDKNETVMLAPGEGFYLTPGKGKNQVRIAYVLEMDELRRSMDLLRKGLHQYRMTLTAQQ